MQALRGGQLVLTGFYQVLQKRKKKRKKKEKKESWDIISYDTLRKTRLCTFQNLKNPTAGRIPHKCFIAVISEEL